MKSSVKRAYFNWVYQLVLPNKIVRQRYERLLSALNATPFRFSVPNDGNRLIDGIDLRYRFCYEHRLTNNEIDDVLDYTTCSVLEMMAALALKLDENIMFDFSLGSRIDIWFLDMIRTLGLEHYTDDRFYEHGYFQIINTFLDRRYRPDGLGGLFLIRNRSWDLRTMEIWDQMGWYVNDILKQ